MPNKKKMRKKNKEKFLNKINIDLEKINLNPSKKILETKNKIFNFYENFKKIREENQRKKKRLLNKKNLSKNKNQKK